MVHSKIAVVTTSLADFDRVAQYEPQSVEYDFYQYNEPLRDKSMTPRLQAKIPKIFGWQLYPGYDYYVWLDGNLRLSHPGSLKYLIDSCAEAVFLQHPDRDTIWWEYRYNWRGLNNNAPSNYLVKRYTNELLDEQMEVIKADGDYVDDLLVNGGVFAYRPTLGVKAMLKEWWYYLSRYIINDQMSLAYVIKTSGIKYNVLPDVFRDCWWLENARHAK